MSRSGKTNDQKPSTKKRREFLLSIKLDISVSFYVGANGPHIVFDIFGNIKFSAYILSERTSQDFSNKLYKNTNLRILA